MSEWSATERLSNERDDSLERVPGGDGASGAEHPNGGDAEVTEQRLEELLAQREVITAGYIHLIGLTKVAREPAQRWKENALRAYAIAQEVMEHRLSRIDLRRRVGDFGFVIAFGEISRSEGGAKCATIAQEIAQRLHGDFEDPTTAEVSSLIKSLKTDEVLAERRRMDYVAQVMSAAAQQQAVKAALPQAETVVAQQIEWDTIKAETEFRYRPVWDVRRKVISTYLCTPSGHVRSASSEVGYEMLPVGAEADLYLRLDLLTLSRIKRDLGKVLDQGQRVLMTCPVHLLTLTRQNTCIAFSNACHLLPNVIKQHLVFEVVGVPEGIPSTRLTQVLAVIKPHQPRSVLLRLGLAHRSFAGLSDAGAFGVGADLTRHGEGEAAAMQKMTAFAAAASRARVRTFLYGAQTISLASAAVCAGFDYVAGDPVAPPVQAPENLVRFQPQNLFARMFGSP